MQRAVSVSLNRRRQALGDAVGEFVLAQDAGDHIDSMLVSCLAQLSRAPLGATLGLVYLSTNLIDHFEEVLDKLRIALPRVNWIGATVDNVLAGRDEFCKEQAIAIMVGEVAVDQFRVLAGARRRLSGRLASINAWRQRNGVRAAWVHGDANNPAVADLVEELSEYVGDATVVGGLVGARKPSLQVAVSVVSGGVSGVLFGRDVEVFHGRALGCSPLGKAHEITRIADNEIFELDCRPALDVLFEEAGELLSRNLHRLTSVINPAFASHRDSNQFAPARFLSVDRAQRSFRVDDRLTHSGTLRFYRRDSDARRLHSEGLLQEAAARTRGRKIRAGMYIAGQSSNNHAGAELAAIRAALGNFPIIGYRAETDIYNGRLFCQTSVLTLLVS